MNLLQTMIDFGVIFAPVRIVAVQAGFYAVFCDHKIATAAFPEMIEGAVAEQAVAVVFA